MWKVLVASVLVAVVLAASPAAAWSNGSRAPNSFGTHDWILNAAIDAAGARGRWVCDRIALRATDDPDTVEGIDHASGTWWHVYDIWGSSTYGGAPEAVEVWFSRTRRQLRNGNRCGASRSLGLMAHLVGDIAQPMHTDQMSREDRVHSSYESAVDSRCTGASSCRYRFHYSGPTHARPYQRTVALARKSHRFYSELVRAFDRHGYNRNVDRITKRQLNRGAQALADLIASLR